MGCSGAHEDGKGGWLPCADQETMLRISKAAETDEKGINVSPSGRRRKRRPKTGQGMWENFRQRRPLGIQALGDGGLVAATTPYRTQPMGDTPANGGSAGAVITLADPTVNEVKATVINPSVNDPDVFRSPSAARMRSIQLGCNGVRRYRSAEGETVWMPCSTGVTYDRQQGFGAYAGQVPRAQQERIEQIVRSEIRRIGVMPNSKKSARRLAATPAKPSERVQGSDTNAAGSAASVTSGKDITLSPEQEKVLLVKAREHNAKMREQGKPAWAMTTGSTLKVVMRRGMGAFSSSHRPDVSSRQQWGMGRVNAFLKMLETGRPNNRRYTTDNDLLKDGHPWKRRAKAAEAGLQIKSKEPVDADMDGWIEEGTPRRRFVGIHRAAEGINRVFSRSRRRERTEKPIRVALDPQQGKPSAERARRRVARGANDAIESLSREGRSTRGFSARRMRAKELTGLTARDAMARKPQRSKHSLLVRTQAEFPHAPAIDATPMVALDELLQEDGSLASTFDHFRSGEGGFSKERQQLHRKILDSILYGNGSVKPKQQENPTAWFFGGGPASGKTFLRQGGFFTNPPRGEDCVHIDADEVKQLIPEFKQLVADLEARGLPPTAAAAVVHAESTYITRLATQEAASKGYNIALDSTGDGGPVSFAKRLEPLRENGYRLQGAYATVSMRKALADAKSREKETGRGIPDDTVLEIHTDVSRAVLYGLQNNLFDDFELASNEDHNNPRVIASARDGKLVVHDADQWDAFVAKAKIDIKETDPYDYFDAANPGVVPKREARFQVADGVRYPVMEPNRQLAKELPKSDIDYGSITAPPPDVRAQIAAAYADLPDYDKEAEKAFDAMRAEVEEQYKKLTEGMGIGVEFVDDDPYPSVFEMMQDLEQNKRLKVLKTARTGSHPYFTDLQNDMFRAVHDAFGHAATGRGFDRHGEEAAYQAHSLMFGDLARRALATETRGQNSAFIEAGEFQPQKVALLPEALTKQAYIHDLQTKVRDWIKDGDDDNDYSDTFCHHTTGGRRLPGPKDDSLAVDPKSITLPDTSKDLTPEQRQNIYVDLVLGKTVDDLKGADKGQVEAYVQKLQKRIDEAKKANVRLDIPTSGVDAVPEPDKGTTSKNATPVPHSPLKDS